jgi:hypothetical protein
VVQLVTNATEEIFHKRLSKLKTREVDLLAALKLQRETNVRNSQLLNAFFVDTVHLAFAELKEEFSELGSDLRIQISKESEGIYLAAVIKENYTEDEDDIRIGVSESSAEISFYKIYKAALGGVEERCQFSYNLKAHRNKSEITYLDDGALDTLPQLRLQVTIEGPEPDRHYGKRFTYVMATFSGDWSGLQSITRASLIEDFREHLKSLVTIPT